MWLAAFDTFRGSARSAELGAAVADRLAHAAIPQPCRWVALSDGGEGFLESMPGAPRPTEVTGPLGDPVTATWKRDGAVGYIEMALASGLELIGGAENNDAIAASTMGTGEVIAAAIEAGCREIVVGLGGSATSDGGLGAVRVLENVRRRGVRLLAACDVDVNFLAAATMFARQKGASDAAVGLLTRRLERVAQLYAQQFGVDVTSMAFAGSAGGLAGGLAAVGAELVSGADFVIERLGIAEQLDEVAGVITGEGSLDDQSLRGKCVGSLVELCAAHGVACLVIAGTTEDEAAARLRDLGATVVDLCATYGVDAAWGQTATVVSDAALDWVGGFAQ